MNGTIQQPTREQWGAYQGAWAWFNDHLFGGTLEPCILNFSRRSRGTYGFFAPDRWRKDEDRTPEISLNPDQMERPPVKVMSTLVHEMVHQWQHQCGRPSRSGYHYAEKNTWYVWLGGKKVSLGVRGEENEADAVKAWHRLMANGRESKPEPKAEAATVKQVIDGFLADAEARVSPGCLRNYRGFLTPFSERFGKGKAEALAAAQAEAYSRKPTWNGTHRRDFLTTLGSAFRWAEQTGLLGSNPLQHLRKPARVVRASLPLISPDEHARLCALARPTFRRFLQVLWLTGARPGEVAGLKAEEVDLAQGVAVLTNHKTAHKGKGRTIFLCPEAVALLREQRAKHEAGYLFPNRDGGKYTENAIGLAIRRLRKRAGIGHAIAYGYRHTFATDALANGIPDAHVAELLGHSGTAMLHKHYAHLGAKANATREALGKVRATVL